MNNKLIFCDYYLMSILNLAVIGCITNSSTASAAVPDEVIYRSPATEIPFVRIHGGKFQMGSPENEPERATNESPLHTVTITKPYYLGTFEVTQAEFSKVMGFNPSEIPGDDRMPVTKVTWYDAISFCNRLSKLDGIPKAYQIVDDNKGEDGRHITSAKVSLILSSHGYRLPTEAEWEFACRAKTESPFVFGNTVNSEQANFDGQTPYNGSPVSEFRNRPFAVNSFQPNPFGLYQMNGNVFEWVWDCYDAYPSDSQTDPTGPTCETGCQRIRRGGAYTSPGHHLRIAVRHSVPPDAAFFHVGFRVARWTPDTSVKVESP